MRVLSSLAALSLGLVVSTWVLAVTGEEAQLIDSINVYRSKAQPCGGEARWSCHRSTATPAWHCHQRHP